jgi:drug/metabolite transporter (DMT)-like permease
VIVTSAADNQHRKLKAAFWMAGWISAMLMLLVAGRETTRELNLFQILEIRSVVGLLLLYPLIRLNGGFASLATYRPLQHLARGLAQYAAQYLWFLAVTLIPLAQVVSIEFTMPIWTAALAVTFLGEKMMARTILAIVLGLIGVAIIVRPEFDESNLGQLIMLVGAAAISISIILTKSLTRTDHVVTIMFWMLFSQSVIGLIPAVNVWIWPPLGLWPWLIVVAICGTFSQYCLSQAMRHVDATVVVSMDFLRVPLSALLGWVLFAERLDAYTFLGAAVILTGNLLNLKEPRNGDH